MHIGVAERIAHVMNLTQFPRLAAVSPAANPLKIAVLYSRPPIPMTRADQKTVAHLIEFLSRRGHQIDLFALEGEELASDEARQWLETKCSRVTFTKKSRIASLVHAGIAAMVGLPLQIGYFWSAGQAKALASGMKTRHYDLIYVYYIRSVPVFKKAREIAKPRKGTVSFLGMQLSQALNTRLMVQKMRRRRDRLLYGIESRHLRDYEAGVWKLFDRVVLIGEKDLAELRQICREANGDEASNVFLCAHGTDIQEFTPDWGANEEENALVFSGVMRTNTNIHAITWFVENVLPLIKKEIPSVRLYIVGRQPSADVRKLERVEGVTVTGEVASPAEYIRRASVCVNPMQVGAGMQNKLLEFLAMGKATVATSLANEGICATPGVDLLIADSAECFAECVISLLHSPARRLALGQSARAFVEWRWTWEAQFLDLEAEFYRTVNANGSQRKAGN